MSGAINFFFTLFLLLLVSQDGSLVQVYRADLLQYYHLLVKVSEYLHLATIFQFHTFHPQPGLNVNYKRLTTQRADGPGGSLGSLILIAPPGQRCGADSQVAEVGAEQSWLPLVCGRGPSLLPQLQL